MQYIFITFPLLTLFIPTHHLFHFDLHQTKAIELTCQTFYPACSLSAIIPLPSPPCKSKCIDAITTCAPFIQETEELLGQPLLFLDCDVTDNGVERWPNTFSVFSINTFCFIQYQYILLYSLFFKEFSLKYS